MNDAVGIVGYGRFGRALGELLAQHGRTIRAHDPAVALPRPLGVRSLTDLADAAGVIVLAVPVAALAGVLEELAPSLGPAHLVLDVGSVKQAPLDIMAAHLGARVPFCGSHPLFGPTSLALGERPLRVVVCRHALHPAAPPRVVQLYRRAGCTVLERDAETHDRVMAEGHALAYFIGKGLLDAGVRLDGELAPPSSRAMAHTLEAVRADAGHLFTSLQRDNPHAAPARRRLLHALESIHRWLDQPDEAQPPRSAAWRPEIPDLGRQAPELREIRELIDDVDREIVALLGRRARLARRAGRTKRGLGLGVRDEAREALLLARRRDWAIDEEMDGAGVVRLFAEILRLSRQLQDEVPP